MCRAWHAGLRGWCFAPLPRALSPGLESDRGSSLWWLSSAQILFVYLNHEVLFSSAWLLETALPAGQTLARFIGVKAAWAWSHQYRLSCKSSPWSFNFQQKMCPPLDSTFCTSRVMVKPPVQDDLGLSRPSFLEYKPYGQTSSPAKL